jgi:hypothetical protein
MIFGLTASASAHFAATCFLVDGSPGASRGFVLRNAAPLIAFLDMLGLSLLLGGMG